MSSVAEILATMGGGGTLVGLGKLLFSAFDKRTAQAFAAKDQTIAVLETERAADARAWEAERARYEAALTRLGAKHDALAAAHQRVCVRAAGVTAQLDEPYRKEMPSAVRDLADLLPSTPRPATVRETYAPAARPTDPAPPNYPRVDPFRKPR